MTKEELEKEAEEIANKRCHEIMCFGHCSFSSPKHHRCGEWHREYNSAKEGIEFGYNKAKEEMQKQDYSLFNFVMQYENGKFKCKYKSGKEFESVDGETWKEIVLPELKETE